MKRVLPEYARRRVFRELLAILGVALFISALAIRFEFSDIYKRWVHENDLERYRVDEALVVLAILSFAFAAFAIRQWYELRRAITARSQAEAELDSQKRRSEAIVANISDVVVILGPDGVFRYQSPSMERVLGYKPEELAGQSAFTLIHPDDLPGIAEAFAEAIANPGRTIRREFRFRNKRGEWQHFQATGANQLGVPGVDGLLIVSRDVTGSKSAEEALHKSNATLQALIEATPAGITVLDLDGKVQLWNASAEQMFGWASAEVTGRVLPIVPNDKHDEFRAVCELVKRGETLDGVEVTRQRKSGTPVEVSLSAAPLRDAAGNVTGIIGIMIDITRRKLAREQSHLQATALSAAANGIAITQLDGTILWVNPAFCKLTGYSAEEVIGQNPRVLKSGEQPPEFYAEMWRTISAGNVWRGEVVNRRKDGTLYTEDMTITPVRNGDDKIHHFIAIKQDITERKRAEDVLRESQARFSSAFEYAAIGMALLDPAGHWLKVNQALCDMLGYPADELLGKTFQDITHPDDLRADLENVRRLLAGEIQSYQMEKRYFHKQGRVLWIHLAVSLVRDAAGRPLQFISQIRDVTERKQAQLAIEDANRRLEQALEDLQAAEQQVIQQERLRALGTMASGIAHDFNNALMPVLGFSELLLHRPGNLDDRAKAIRYLELINTSARDAGSIVNRLRQFYRHREDDDVFAPIDSRELIRDAISLTKPKWQAEAQARGVDITIDTDLRTVPVIAGSAPDLREALTNLIFNAVDALPGGGTITLRTRRCNGQVLIEVADTGTGMTEDVRRRCLEPFFSTKGERGTGLGLSMVYGIVQRHGGKVEIQSTPGTGTVFTIYLPAPSASGDDQTAPATAPSNLQSLRLLLVEDDAQVRAVITEYLTGEGHTVTGAETGLQGLEQLKAGQFDVLLVDRAMPGMSGDQFAITAKSLVPATPIIMLTGFGAMMLAAGEIPPGVDSVVSKPITIQELREALAHVTPSSGN